MDFAEEIKSMADTAMTQAYNFISRGRFKGEDPIEVAESIFIDMLDASKLARSADMELKALILFRIFAEEYEAE